MVLETQQKPNVSYLATVKKRILFAMRKEGRTLLLDVHACDCSVVVNQNVSLADLKGCKENKVPVP
jgi:hypothetical protein